MSIQNFPRIPKITLIKPCDQAKEMKNKKYGFCFQNIPYFLYYCTLLRGATLKHKLQSMWVNWNYVSITIELNYVSITIDTLLET